MKVPASLLMILLLALNMYGRADKNGDLVDNDRDTVVVKKWKEKGRLIAVTMRLKNEAGAFGVNPGAATESWVEVKKTEKNGGTTSTIISKKDTCNPQEQQLVFYFSCTTMKDLDKDGRNEVIMVYEFASDGFDDRKLIYLIVSKNQIYQNSLKLSYSEDKMTYEVKTSKNEFIRKGPMRFQRILASEYSRIKSCIN